MGVHWKSKQTQKNLLGKSTLAHQNSNLSPVIQCIGQEAVPHERIVNGGFETGDCTGWTCGGSTPYCSAETESPHSGSFVGRVNNPSPATWIEQEFSPVSVSSIVTFEFYNRTGLGAYARAEITYSDDTTVTVVDPGTGWTWRKIELKGALDPTKKVKKIKLYYLEAGNVLDIDDVSLIA